MSTQNRVHKTRQKFLDWFRNPSLDEQGRPLIRMTDGRSFRITKMGVHDLYIVDQIPGDVYRGRLTATQVAELFCERAEVTSE